MKPVVFTLFLLVIAGYLLPGCAPVADPRQGGLFGYSPELYEQRAAERRQRLGQLEAETVRQQKEKEGMTSALAAKGKEVAGLKEKTASLEKDLSSLRASLQQQEEKTAAAGKRKRQLEQRLRELEEEFRQLNSSAVTLSEKQQKLQRLQQEKEKLQKEAELLSTLY